ncbi:unnamed protein product [Euphydryas editha]|uniref:Uncharacterized protein n=1 Tax=Euphydryas editha TaxID=104508 RepID=A0AAU9UKF9_EUPED|nr:unnamed protein product [Euphydryas editha]
MWCRVLTFCVLVTIILLVVLSCLYGRPVYHLFFHRCCSDDIENDQVIFENFGNNFPRERLIGADIMEVDNTTLYDPEEAQAVLEDIKSVFNVHDPGTRVFTEKAIVEDSEKEITNFDNVIYSDIEVLTTTDDYI